MEYNLPKNRLLEILNLAQEKLLTFRKIKFEKSIEWREKNIPKYPGVYALFEKSGNLVYIGESGNLNKRMDEINRTVNHSFRKQTGFLKYNGIKSTKKYDIEIENKLDLYFAEELYVAYIEVCFGRLEIEEFIITNHQNLLTNSVKKRKLQTTIKNLK